MAASRGRLNEPMLSRLNALNARKYRATPPHNAAAAMQSMQDMPAAAGSNGADEITGMVMQPVPSRPPTQQEQLAAATLAAPNRAIKGPASRNVVTGTMKGPGAIARPIFSAGQCHTPSCHSTSESRKPPNTVENGAIVSVARMKSRIRNRFGSMNRLVDRTQCATNSASMVNATAKLRDTPYEFQPQSCSFTIANVSAPMPVVMPRSDHG